MREDIEMSADTSVFDELLISENSFFQTNQSLNMNNLNGQMTFTRFGTIYGLSNLATVRAAYGVERNVYQYEVQLGSNGPIQIGWATQSCEFADSVGVGTYIIIIYTLKKKYQLF